MIWIYVLKVVRDGNDYFSACCSSRFGAGANNWKSLIKGRKISLEDIQNIFDWCFGVFIIKRIILVELWSVEGAKNIRKVIARRVIKFYVWYYTVIF